MDSTLVPLQQTSLKTQHGLFLQHLGLDVALRSTPTDSESLQQERMIAVLAILNGLLKNTFSGDIMELAVYDAKDTCERLQISEDVFKEIIHAVRMLRSGAMKNNPINQTLFGGE